MCQKSGNTTGSCNIFVYHICFAGVYFSIPVFTEVSHRYSGEQFQIIYVSCCMLISINPVTFAFPQSACLWGPRWLPRSLLRVAHNSCAICTWSHLLKTFLTRIHHCCCKSALHKMVSGYMGVHFSYIGSFEVLIEMGRQAVVRISKYEFHIDLMLWGHFFLTNRTFLMNDLNGAFTDTPVLPVQLMLN